MPIVMGMVAGVFFRFGLDLVFAIRDDFWIAAPMVGGMVSSTILTLVVIPVLYAIAFSVLAFDFVIEA